jgi:hypothetical protein
MAKRERGDGIRKRGDTWYYRFTDENGQRHEQKGCTDRRVTEELARAAKSRVAQIKGGNSRSQGGADHHGRATADQRTRR